MRIQFDACWSVTPSTENISTGLDYVVKNLLDIYGLRFSAVSIYANLEDCDGNKVCPGFEDHGVIVKYNLLTGTATVEPNFSEWFDPQDYLPIESILTDYNHLPPRFTEQNNADLAQLRQAIQTAEITVRRIEQISGIDGALICSYLSEQAPIPSETMPVLMTAINDYNSEREEDLAQADAAKIDELFPPALGRHLSPHETVQIIRYTLLGLTDAALQYAIEQTQLSLGKVSIAYLCRVLDTWVEQGLYAGRPPKSARRGRS